MESSDYQDKCIRLQPGQNATGLQGILFVDGFSECGVEFQLDKLLKLEWPNAPKYLLTFDRHNPAVLADVLEQNRFRMVVIPALTRSFDEQYKEYIGFGKGALKRHRPSIDRILAAMKSAVEDEGAILVLFCSGRAEWIHKELFDKTWKDGEYLRTDCFRTAAAAAAIPHGPAVVNAKAVHLTGVPKEEQWYASTEGSLNSSILFQAVGTTGPPAGAGLCSIAIGKAGNGQVMYLGDVNAEDETCLVVAHLAHALYATEADLAQQRNAHAAFAPMWTPSESTPRV